MRKMQTKVMLKMQTKVMLKIQRCHAQMQTKAVADLGGFHGFHGTSLLKDQ